MDQLSFASLDFAAKKKRTKRDVFLAEMAAVVPWSALESVVEPHYPRVGPQGGRRPFPLPVMVRIYCLQQWYSLSDPGAEEALYDIQSMRSFCGLELGRDAIPVDTHVHRVARRLGLVPAKVSAERAELLLHDLVPDGLRTSLHVGLIRLGREICKAPTPRCALCPLKDVCPTAPRYLPERRQRGAVPERGADFARGERKTDN